MTALTISVHHETTGLRLLVTSD